MIAVVVVAPVTVDVVHLVGGLVAAGGRAALRAALAERVAGELAVADAPPPGGGVEAVGVPAHSTKPFSRACSQHTAWSSHSMQRACRQLAW